MYVSCFDNYKVGMTVYGKITGIKPYGAFVGFEDGVSGLIHISEISNRFVKDISNYVNVGDYCMLKIIDIDEQHKQLRLSYKALVENTRKHGRRVRFEGLPISEKGFGTIRDNMPMWISEGLKND